MAYSHVSLGLIIGLAVGVIMSVPVWFGYIGSLIAGVPVLGAMHAFLNTPAAYIAAIWTDLFRFPPRGEAAWIVVPAVAIIFQWMLAGLALCLLWGLLHRLSQETGSNLHY